MPVCHIDGPEGLRRDARETLVKRVTSILRETYTIPDIHIFFREYAADRWAHDGVLGHRAGLIVTLSVPEARLELRRTLASALHDAFAQTYGGIADTENTLFLIHEYPLDRVGWRKTLQSDKPELVQLVQQLRT